MVETALRALAEARLRPPAAEAQKRPAKRGKAIVARVQARRGKPLKQPEAAVGDGAINGSKPYQTAAYRTKRRCL
ncbi:MAG: hypothetical protein LBD24_04345 [Spirochaetaceae bacterium]|nr:hypothetical protein [Spirochaetaceae bacterium]